MLLSLASQLGLVNTRLGMLLLGVTAISLMMTPVVLNVAARLMADTEFAALPGVRSAARSPRRRPKLEHPV